MRYLFAPVCPLLIFGLADCIVVPSSAKVLAQVVQSPTLHSFAALPPQCGPLAFPPWIAGPTNVPTVSIHQSHVPDITPVSVPKHHPTLPSSACLCHSPPAYEFHLWPTPPMIPALVLFFCCRIHSRCWMLLLMGACRLRWTGRSWTRKKSR